MHEMLNPVFWGKKRKILRKIVLRGLSGNYVMLYLYEALRYDLSKTLINFYVKLAV